jgi:hypothetical protein
MEKSYMAAILDTAKGVYAPGPTVTPKEPDKADIIRLFGLIEAILGSAVNGLLVGSAVVYQTRAALFANLARPDGSLGIAYGDSNPAYNGYYAKVGASGSGSWTLTNLALPSTFAFDLATVISAQAATQAEVTDARQGSPSVGARISAVLAWSNDQDAAQNEFFNDRIDVVSEAQSATQAEVVAARGGLPNLAVRLQALADAIAAGGGEAGEAIAALSAALAEEITDRQFADNALNTKINNERVAWESAVTQVTGEIVDEETARILVDIELHEKINNERLAWEAAVALERDNRVDAVIDEQAAREIADLAIPSGGDLMSRCFTDGVIAGGATAVGDGPLGDGTKLAGFVIPAGQAAVGTFVRATVPFSKDDILALKGKVVDFVYTAFVTPGMLTLMPPSPLSMLVASGTGLTEQGAVISTTETNNPGGDGATLKRVVRYLVTGDEDSIGLVWLANGSTTTTIDVILKLTGITFRVVEDATNSALNTSGSTFDLLRPRNSGEPVSIEIPMAALQIIGEAFAGGQHVYDSSRRLVGLKIPSGQQGDGTYISARYKPGNDEIVLYRGARVRVAADFDVIGTPNVKLSAYVRYISNSGPVIVPGQVVKVNKLVRAGLYRFVSECDLPAGTIVIDLVVQVDPSSTSGVATGDQQYAMRGISIRVLAPAGGIAGPVSGGYKETPADINAKLRGIMSSRKGRVLASTETTARAAAMDASIAVPASYSTITAALAAISDAGDSNRVEIAVSPGIYTDVDWFAEDHVDVRGVGRVTINAALPANASLDDIAIKSAFNIIANDCRISNLNITAKNLRYVLHCDYQGGEPNAKMVVEDCSFTHLGNEEARAYRVSIAQDPNLVWDGTSAIGPAPFDGGEQTFRRVKAVGYKLHALGGHNFINARAPTILTLEECTLIAGEGDYFSMIFRLLGSGQRDIIRTVGNVFNAPVALGAWPWLLTQPNQQLANKMDVVWTGHGNTPTPYIWEDEGSRALRIEANADGVGISISGSAVPVIFGDVVTVPAAEGLPGAVYGIWDVGVPGRGTTQFCISIGERLGDRTGTPLTLTVTPTSGSPVTITMGENYTAQSNATILAAINAALGSSMTASFFNVNDLFRPCFSDEETIVRNAGNSTIRRKTAVAYLGDTFRGRTMTATDDASLFAGIAYEDIRPGDTGRVKSSGMVRVAQDMLRSDSVAFSLGDTFGVGSTPGRFIKGAAIPLMRAVGSHDVMVRAK